MHADANSFHEKKLHKTSEGPVELFDDLFRSNGLVSLHVDRGDTDEVSFKIA